MSLLAPAAVVVKFLGYVKPAHIAMLLSKVPIWKKLQSLPSRVSVLEEKIATIEKRDVTDGWDAASGDPNLRTCRECGRVGVEVRVSEHDGQRTVHRSCPFCHDHWVR